MDSYSGHYDDRNANDGNWPAGAGDDDSAREAPPQLIGQDERRMQVRAYNYWASLLDGRNFPAIADLDPAALPDFGPYSVLLDFTKGIENPAIQYLGSALADECDAAGTISVLTDVPSRSLLSRITDHYMQILANQAPIGFEAEFVNQRERTILYRGILLPFSSDDATIDFIYGVINWKELADQHTTDELLLEIEQALEPQQLPARRGVLPATGWADGPAESNLIEMRPAMALPDEDGVVWPVPAFGGATAIDLAADEPLELTFTEVADEDMELADWLASAREMALAAQGSEDRTRQALYAAIGRAFDFSLAAAAAPADFEELIAESGLTIQDRAPMTPVVKLVFGADYDKTRLTEYASALSHAHRLGLGRGELAGFLASAPGGLKGVVNAERRCKRADSGKGAVRQNPRDALAAKLRKLAHQPLAAIETDGSEFTLLVARRLPTGEVVLVGEVADDDALLERAAKKLLAD